MEPQEPQAAGEGTRSSGTLWIAWEDDSSIRSRVLANELGSEFHAFTGFTHSKFLGWLRYPLAAAQTAWSVLQRRPRLLVVQNPSILLAFEGALLGQVLSLRVVIDLHTPYIQPRGLGRLIQTFLNNYALRHCTAVIVTNEEYRTRVMQRTARPVLVLPDKVPTLGSDTAVVLPKGRHSVLYVCTFSDDEPWLEVLAAAEMLPKHTHLYVSGKAPAGVGQVPDNVTLTGFMPRREYEGLLRSVDAVMVLTTADENLVCGGYEAVAAGKPLILSDTSALRQLFDRGTVFTKNRREDIARAIGRACEEAARLATDVEALRETMRTAWSERWRTLLAHIERPG